MTKKVKSGIIGGVVVATLIIAAIWVSIFRGRIISEAEAKTIAFEHASVEYINVEMLNVYLDKDDFIRTYEIQFYVGNIRYQYDIDARNGNIKDFEVEGMSRNNQNTNNTNNNSNGTENTNNQTNTNQQVNLTEADAKKLALDRVPGAIESDIWLRRDYEDGRVVYEGTIIYDRMEYDFEIDANNGTFYSWEVESVYD
jgi:Predicted membrane protein